jgi:lambda family phage portal protein
MTAEDRQIQTAKRIRAQWSRAGHESPRKQKGNLDIVNYQSTGFSPLNWSASQTSADGALRYNLRSLIDKSRTLRLTNPYAERFAHEMESNVLSSEGMALQMQIKQDAAITLRDGTEIPAGAPDKGANTAIEDAWYDFWHCKGHCDVSGELTGLDAEKIALSGAVIDGTPLIRLVRGFDNDWGFAIQLMDIDALDLNYNAVLGNGNEVRMSIEVDKWGRRVAAHVLKYKAGDWEASSFGGVVQSTRDRVRIPFEGFQDGNDNGGTIIAPFMRKRSGQTLGWPWLTPVMDVLHSLVKYEEAELVATRAAAEKMGFWERTEGAEEYSGEQDKDGNFIMPSVPGMIEKGPVGWHFQGWNPTHPNGNYGEYRKGVLRQIASGLGVSYNVLANDLEGVNYSSLRGGLLDEREIYKMIQKWFIDQFETVVFNAWLEMALLGGKIKLDNGSALPATKIDKFNKPYFQGRRWQWVDPKKDI